MERFSALIGFVVILGIAFLLSNKKRAIRWRTVGWGLALQIVIAITVLKGELIAQTFAPIALPLERYGAAILFRSGHPLAHGWVGAGAADRHRHHRVERGADRADLRADRAAAGALRRGDPLPIWPSAGARLGGGWRCRSSSPSPC